MKEKNYAVDLETYKKLKDYLPILHAPTLDEMLEHLPGWFLFFDDIYGRTIKGHFFICYESLKTGVKAGSFDIKNGDNPATAAAKLYIWLRDKKYI